MYAPLEADKVARMANSLKPVNAEAEVTGTYKDDDSQYSLENLLKRQKEGGFL
jgi:hypothetical protein